MLVLQVVLLVVVLGFVLVAFLTNPTPERQFEERALGGRPFGRGAGRRTGR